MSKSYFIVEVNATKEEARILRVSDKDYGVLQAQIDIGAAPALRWSVRTRWLSIENMKIQLGMWVLEWIAIIALLGFLAMIALIILLAISLNNQ